MVTPRDRDRGVGIVVDQAHLDLAAVPGVDGAGVFTIESPVRAARPDRGWIRPTMPTGMATATPRSDEPAPSGRQFQVDGRVEVNAGVTGMPGSASAGRGPDAGAI